jgi:hypothetical protein
MATMSPCSADAMLRKRVSSPFAKIIFILSFLLATMAIVIRASPSCRRKRKYTTRPLLLRLPDVA